MNSVKSLNRIFWYMEYWFKALECQIWLMNTKPFFWKSETSLETFQNLFLYIGVSSEFVLKSVTGQKRIFWVIEHWFKALECQVCSTNTKPFFWESEANLKTLWKLSPYIGVSYRFNLKSVKTLNRILLAMEYWFKALECQIWSTNTKPFFRESETKLRFVQKLSPYIGVAYKFVLKCVRNLSWLWFSFFQMLQILNVQLYNIQLEIM